MTLSYPQWKKINHKSKKKRVIKKQEKVLVCERYVDYCVKKAKQRGQNVNQAMFDGVYQNAISKVFGSYSNTLKNLDDSRPIMEVHLEK